MDKSSDREYRELVEKLTQFTTLFLDADGVFFDGQEYRTKLPDGSIAIGKARSYQDGQGLSFLRALGITIVFVTGEGEPLQSVVEKINNLPSVKEGLWAPVELFTDKNSKGAKVETIRAWLTEHTKEPRECAYMGDDINDYEPMQWLKGQGALTMAPSNATRRILSLANRCLTKAGGKGAIREFAEMVLDARDVDESTLPPA